MKIRDFVLVYCLAIVGLSVSSYGGKVVWDKNGVPHIEQKSDNIKGCYQSLDKNETKKSCDEK